MEKKNGENKWRKKMERINGEKNGENKSTN